MPQQNILSVIVVNRTNRERRVERFPGVESMLAYVRFFENAPSFSVRVSPTGVRTADEWLNYDAAKAARS